MNSFYRSRFAPLLAVMVMLSGCSYDGNGEFPPASEENPKITVPFDPAAGTYVLRAGTGTVSGVVSLRLPDNAQVIGKFARLRLIPITAYSTEYIRLLFRGKKTYRWGASVSGVDPRFNQHMRYSTADKDGKYIFHGVPAGRYFVYSIAGVKGRYFAVYDEVAAQERRITTLALVAK